MSLLKLQLILIIDSFSSFYDTYTTLSDYHAQITYHICPITFKNDTNFLNFLIQFLSYYIIYHIFLLSLILIIHSFYEGKTNLLHRN